MPSKDDLKCNRPVKSWREGKKYAVKACENGEEKLIHFGATGYSDFTKHKDESRRDNFRARHNCDKAKSKLTAKYWACEYLWPKGNR